MQKRITVTFNKISFIQKIDIKSIMDIFLKNPYDEDKGIGFTKAEIIEDVLETTLVKRVPTSLQEFDPKSGNFVQRDIFIFDEITFYIDLQNNLIYSYSSASKLNSVKSILKNYIKNNNVIYNNLDLNPRNFINDLINNKFECAISEIVIRKFIYNQGAQGKFSAHILDSKTGQKLLDDYSEEIQKMTINVSSSENNDFTLTISTNNTLGIRSEDDDFLSILSNLKNQI